MSTYDKKIAEARATLLEHEAKIQEIGHAIACGLEPTDVSEEGELGPPVDCRPRLKEYAKSEELDPLLLESKLLYDEMIPTMIHLALESENGVSGYDEPLDLYERAFALSTDRRWVEIVGRWTKWNFVTYSHQDFIQIVRDKQEAGEET
jgi:hypothetical protein